MVNVSIYHGDYCDSNNLFFSLVLCDICIMNYMSEHPPAACSAFSWLGASRELMRAGRSERGVLLLSLLSTSSLD